MTIFKEEAYAVRLSDDLSSLQKGVSHDDLFNACKDGINRAVARERDLADPPVFLSELKPTILVGKALIEIITSCHLHELGGSSHPFTINNCQTAAQLENAVAALYLEAHHYYFSGEKSGKFSAMHLKHLPADNSKLVQYSTSKLPDGTLVKLRIEANSAELKNVEMACGRGVLDLAAVFKIASDVVSHLGQLKSTAVERAFSNNRPITDFSHTVRLDKDKVSFSCDAPNGLPLFRSTFPVDWSAINLAQFDSVIAEKLQVCEEAMQDANQAMVLYDPKSNVGQIGQFLSKDVARREAEWNALQTQRNVAQQTKAREIQTAKEQAELAALKAKKEVELAALRKSKEAAQAKKLQEARARFDEIRPYLNSWIASLEKSQADLSKQVAALQRQLQNPPADRFPPSNTVAPPTLHTGHHPGYAAPRGQQLQHTGHGRYLH